MSLTTSRPAAHLARPVTTGRQRSQSSGWSRLAPTRSLQVQQRWHFRPRLLLHLRDDEERGQERALGTEERGQVLGRVHQDDARLEPAPDEPTRARGLERLRDLAAYLEEAAPLAREPVVEPLHRLLGEPLEVDALAPGA